MGNEGQKICGDLPETTAFKSYAAKQERRSQYPNCSDLPAVSFLRLTHSEASEGYPTIVNNIQPCPKLCLLMPLAYVGARTDSTSYTATREAWPISAHAHWRSRQDMLYLRRGFSTLVLLVWYMHWSMLKILVPMVTYMYTKKIFMPNCTYLWNSYFNASDRITCLFILAIGDSSSPWLKSFVFQIVCTVLLIMGSE